ncbi:hypothetical protein CYMTET_29903 [Cymbomonas tetramitiformis]|uniref:NADH dehydrogenase [ubiquinone] 1 alpha subcomplex subunit 12 n=1 Tax=Cymbomonas tetramitiformis TaxID=36881 RepID=A0AAE0FKD1_9CHLO|nr:hypothetical protein CYMTET_29903 [Cymbomonas tetramitiformis]
MFRSLLQGIRKAVFAESGTFVGKDRMGNEYFRKVEMNPYGREIERRWVKQTCDFEDFNLENVGVEWNSWLNGNRESPPTEEEMMKLNAQRNAIKQRVQALAAEEEKRKLRTRSLQEDEAASPSMPHLLQQMNANSQTPEEDQGVLRAPRVEVSEPSGHDSNFKPGTWEPVGRK